MNERTAAERNIEPINPERSRIVIMDDGSRKGWDGARREWFNYDTLAKLQGDIW